MLTHIAQFELGLTSSISKSDTKVRISEFIDKKRKRKRNSPTFEEDIHLHHGENMYICKPARQKARVV